MTSSELPDIVHQYQRYLHRIDALEQKLEESIAAKRQRASSLLEVLPTHRSSHLRLFVTHHVDEGCRKRWTLVLEGKLLVGYLDHENAILSDQDAVPPSITVATNTSSSSGNIMDSSNTAASNRLSRDFTNRGYCDNDYEEPPPMIKFSHFFDKIAVSFQPFYRALPKGGGTDGGTQDISTDEGVKVKRIVKELSSGSKRKSTDLSAQANVPFLSPDKISTLQWDRETNNDDDMQAFHLVYDDIPPDKETVIVATIHLFKRMGPKERFKPSDALAALLFSHRPIKSAEDEKKKKTGLSKSPRTSLDDLISPNKKARAQTNLSHSTSASNLTGPDNPGTRHEDNQGTRTVVPRYQTIPLDNDVHIPTLFTLEEIMGALFRYIKDRNLWNEADASLIQNNATLFSLFDCETMTLTQMKGMLFSRNLIEKVGAMDQPIVLTYVMRRDEGMPRVNDEVLVPPSTDAPATQGGMIQHASTTIQSNAMNNVTIDDSWKSIVGAYPNYLTFDIDIDVPLLFPFRTREILGRIKRREFEWTNARTKALRMIQASRVDEELIKEKLEDIVKGRGLSKEHIPILLALAKTSSTGSQAQICAHIDARVAFLMQRLEYHTELAKACWNVVDGFRKTIK